MAWLASVLLGTIPIVFIQGLYIELPSITLLFLHFELLVSVLPITQAMESGGWYKSCYRFSIELVLDFRDEWESYITLIPIPLYNQITREEMKEEIWTIIWNLNQKAQIFAYLKFIAYFENNTSNSWNSIKKKEIEKRKYKEKIRIKVTELKLNRK
jgi:hypothetical protein